MKIRTGLPLLAIVAIIFAFQLTMTSCGKNELIKLTHDTVTVRDTITVRDTLNLDTAITLSMLTGTSWKIQEIRGVTGNAPYYYLRGGASNTQSFDYEYMTFNADSTGIVTDNGGTHTPITWKFANAEKTSITYSVPFPDGTVLVTWEHMTYKKGGIRYGEYFTNLGNGKNSHSEAIRIPLNSGNVNVRL